MVSFSVVGFALGFAMSAVFAGEARRILSAISETVGGFVTGCADLARESLLGIWRLVKPERQIEIVPSILGLFIIVFGAIVVVANYTVLAPTLEVVLPSGDLADFVAVAIVGLGCAVGILLELCPKIRPSCIVAVGMLTSVVTLLAFIQTMAVTEGNVLLSALRALVALTLQIVEVLAFKGGISLAGHFIPPIMASPGLLSLGLLWVAFRLLQFVGVEMLLTGAVGAVVDAAERAAMVVLRWLRSAGKAERDTRRFDRQKADHARARELADLDMCRGAELARRREEEEERLAWREHTRAIRTLLWAKEREVLPRIHSEIFAAGERCTLDVLDEIEPTLKSKAAEATLKGVDDAVRQISNAALAVYRHVGYFNPGPPRNTGGKNDDSITIN
jgi:hypothetical protein